MAAVSSSVMLRYLLTGMMGFNELPSGRFPSRSAERKFASVQPPIPAGVRLAAGGALGVSVSGPPDNAGPWQCRHEATVMTYAPYAALTPGAGSGRAAAVSINRLSSGSLPATSSASARTSMRSRLARFA